MKRRTAQDGPAVVRIPANEAAERAVLGAILADSECYARAAACLNAGDFYSDSNRTIFEACRILAETGIPADLLTVTDQLERDGAIASVGGVAYVASLAEGLPDPANVEHYAKIVRGKATERRCLRISQDLMAAVAGGNGNSEGALAAVKAELAAVLEHDFTGTRDIVGGTELLAGLWQPVETGFLTTQPPRRRWLLTQPESQRGHGLLPRGKAGIIASEGGIGKTSALVELGICVVTGRPWLGYYLVPPTVTGSVLLLLAEEDADDAHRRIWTTAEALRLSDAERAECAARLFAIPLAGVPVALTAVSGAGLVETRLARALRDRLVRNAGPDGWALVGLDPLSRFAGGDIEASNEAATRYVQVLESLASVPGHPSVLVSAHSSKVARRQGQADVRGVTGLSDAARWVATLRREDDEVIFAVTKSNYSLPCPPLRLRWHDGMLVAVSGAEILEAAHATRAAQDAELDDEVRRVVAVLAREGTMTSRDAIAHAAGLRLARGRAAIDLAIARGLVKPSGTGKRPRYSVAVREGGESTPHTPRTAGTGYPALGPNPSGLPGTGTGRAGTGGRIASDSDAPLAPPLQGERET